MISYLHIPLCQSSRSVSRSSRAASSPRTGLGALDPRLEEHTDAGRELHGVFVLDLRTTPGGSLSSDMNALNPGKVTKNVKFNKFMNELFNISQSTIRGSFSLTALSVQSYKSLI